MPGTEPRGSRSLSAWLEALEGAHVQQIDLGLERVGRVWAALGAPRPGRQVVTVAGTNGKGSTVHALEALARAHGLRVGTTTSPHLLRFNERIRLDGVEACDEDIVAAFERIEAARLALAEGPVSLSYFETAILAALLLLAEYGCDLAVLEVGLGGRLDAVNIVDADIAVITPVDLDHQSWLGDDRETIGAEKAGIMRAGAPVVLTDPSPPASVLARAAALGAPLLRIGRDFDFAAGRYDGQGCAAGLAACHLEGLGEPGLHPAAVAAALTTLRLLDLVPDATRSRAALDGLVLAGRAQRIETAGTSYLLDVAHNPHAAAALAERFEAGERFELLFGAFADKDVEGLLAPLLPFVDGVTLVATPGARGTTAAALAERLEPLGLPAAATAPTVAAGLQRARSRAAKVLVCGSFTVVGAALELLGEGARP